MGITTTYTFWMTFKQEEDAEKFAAYFPIGNQSESCTDELDLVAHGWPPSDDWMNASLIRDGAFIHAVAPQRDLPFMDLLYGKKKNELSVLYKKTRLLVLRVLGEEGGPMWYCAADGKVTTAQLALDHAIKIGVGPAWLMILATYLDEDVSALKKVLAAGVDPNIELRNPDAEVFPAFGIQRYRALDSAVERMAHPYPELVNQGREMAVALLEAGADPGLLSKRIKKTADVKALLARYAGNSTATKKAAVKAAPPAKKKAAPTKKAAPKKNAAAKKPVAKKKVLSKKKKARRGR